MSQGIHNLFIVIPQFIVTGVSSIIFAIFDPDQSVLHGGHGGIPMHNSTTTDDGVDVDASASGDLAFRALNSLSPARRLMSRSTRIRLPILRTPRSI